MVFLYERYHEPDLHGCVLGGYFCCLFVLDQFLDEILRGEEAYHAHQEVQVVGLLGELLVGGVYEVEEGADDCFDEVRQVGQGELHIVTVALFNQFSQDVQREEDHLGMWVTNRERDELHRRHIGLLVLYRHIFQHIGQRNLLRHPGLPHDHLPIGFLNPIEMTLQLEPQFHVQLVQLKVLELFS